MSVHDDYESRTFGELCEDALKIIEKQPGLRCGTIGNYLFGDVAHLLGSAPYARLAGKVMRKLERDGQAVYRVVGGWGGWYSTKENWKR